MKKSTIKNRKQNKRFSRKSTPIKKTINGGFFSKIIKENIIEQSRKADELKSKNKNINIVSLKNLKVGKKYRPILGPDSGSQDITITKIEYNTKLNTTKTDPIYRIAGPQYNITAKEWWSSDNFFGNELYIDITNDNPKTLEPNAISKSIKQLILEQSKKADELKKKFKNIKILKVANLEEGKTYRPILGPNNGFQDITIKKIELYTKINTNNKDEIYKIAGPVYNITAIDGWFSDIVFGNELYIDTINYDVKIDMKHLENLY